MLKFPKGFSKRFLNAELSSRKWLFYINKMNRSCINMNHINKKNDVCHLKKTFEFFLGKRNIALKKIHE